jgi:hypothetical protein
LGNGAPLKVDETVGKTWEIEASKVTLHNRRWPAALRNLTAQVVQGLRCYASDDYMDASLDKLVLCEVGGSFEAHNDMEREPGVFATMVRGNVGSISDAQPRLPRRRLMLCVWRVQIVQLPTAFEGGVITVKHKVRVHESKL